MAKLGFLGLDIMGAPMARHLLEAGHEVALWSNTSANTEKLASVGRAVVCRASADICASIQVPERALHIEVISNPPHLVRSG